MSAIGLPMNGHVSPHLNADGYCQCPCGECTLRLIRDCICMECPCDEPGEDHWPSVTQGPVPPDAELTSQPTVDVAVPAAVTTDSLLPPPPG
jgi:hypothetical protein